MQFPARTVSADFEQRREARAAASHLGANFIRCEDEFSRVRPVLSALTGCGDAAPIREDGPLEGNAEGDVVTDVVSRVVDGTVLGPKPVSRSSAPRHLRPVPNDQGVAAGIDDVAAQALDCGLRRVQILARRDFEDPEAGESELIVHHMAAIWAKAGLEVTLRTAEVAGLEAVTTRDGYRVVRKSGPYAVFVRNALSGLSRPKNKPDGVVEIWDGMPFVSPIWARRPRVVVVHHVQAEMWRMGRTSKLAKLGQAIKLRLASHQYRHSHIVTSSASSRDDLAALLDLDPRRIDVVRYGVDERFSPGGSRSREPLVVALGQFLPLKGFDALVDTLVDVRRFVPDLRAEIVGNGGELGRIESRIANAGAADWITLRPRVSAPELGDIYRRGWVVASTSTVGYDLSIAEAGACGTPSVASKVGGNRDNVSHEVSGLLAEPGPEFTAALVRILTDEVLRQRLSRGALERACELTWEGSAAGLLSALMQEVRPMPIQRRSARQTENERVL